MRSIIPNISGKLNKTSINFGKANYIIPAEKDQTMGVFTDDESMFQTNEYGIIQDVISDIKKAEDFRFIQKAAYNSNENTGESMTIQSEMKSLEQSSDMYGEEKMYFKFQAAYIQKCKKYCTLPLPIVKKIKYETLVLENYQISPQIAKAFGRSAYLLGKYLKGIKLINNNLKDQDISFILDGIVMNPIRKYFFLYKYRLYYHSK